MSLTTRRWRNGELLRGARRPHPGGRLLCHVDCSVMNCVRRGTLPENFDLVVRTRQGRRLQVNMSVIAVKQKRRGVTIHLFRNASRQRRLAEAAGTIVRALRDAGLLKGARPAIICRTSSTVSSSTRGINIAGSSTGPSNGNMVQANRLNNNNLEGAPSNSMCNLMVNGYARDNTIAENEVLGTHGVGIMIGPASAPGAVSGNRFAQNRVHGFGGPGIIVQGVSATGNVIVQNDARGNGLNWSSPRNVDLFDSTNPVANTWANNLGTCGPGVC